MKQTGRLNNRVAEKATLIFGTMWMFYGFFIYGLLPLVPQFQPYQTTLMYWSTWVQLWALPLLMVGQNILGKAAELQNQETHDAVMEEMAIVKEELSIAREERDKMKEILIQLHMKIRDIET